MRLLAEIYQIPELKLNLKFEIELLCNHLGLDLNGTFLPPPQIGWQAWG
jgi:hypothetical protein